MTPESDEREADPRRDPKSACGRCKTVLGRDELRCPVCGLCQPRQDNAAPDRARAEVIRCTVCRAAVAHTQAQLSLRCAYCGSDTRAEVPTDPIDAPELFVPFTLTPSHACESLDGFLKNAGSFAPSDVADMATVDLVRAVWWPAWMFDTQALFSYMADSDSGAREANWAPHAGQVEGQAKDFCLPASRGLSDEETDFLLPSYRLDTAQADPVGPEGATIECFELPRSRSRQKIVQAIDERARGHLEQIIPGTVTRHLSIVSRITGLKTTNVMLPVYILNYRYGKERYRVVVSGQDATRIKGALPLSMAKVALAIALGIAAIGLVVAYLTL